MPEGEWAWSRDDARAALASLEGSIVAVFEVEVYAIPFGQHEVIHTGRRATYFYRSGELALQFAERTRQEADEFIDAGSNDELFVLHFSGQDDTESAHGSLRSGTG
jgi:hypothetical protein